VKFFSKPHISIDCVERIASVVILQNCRELAAYADRFACENFEEVAECDEFKRIRVKELLHFISSSDLNASCEEQVRFFECTPVMALLQRVIRKTSLSFFRKTPVEHELHGRRKDFFQGGQYWIF